MTEETSEGPNFSKSEVGDLVQAAFAMCATCGHMRSEHAPVRCAAKWKTGDRLTGEIEHSCRCEEYWPIRRERLDRLHVVGREIAIGGSVGIQLDRRAPTEMWDRLLAGEYLAVRVHVQMEGKSFKASRSNGVITGVVESRKLRFVRLEYEEGDDAEA